jgi:hypothetical protein
MNNNKKSTPKVSLQESGIYVSTNSLTAETREEIEWDDGMVQVKRWIAHQGRGQDGSLDTEKMISMLSDDIAAGLHAAVPKLLLLGYASFPAAYEVFASVCRLAVSISDPNSEQNKALFFCTEDGRTLLKRLIWCSSSGHRHASLSAIRALNQLSALDSGSRKNVAAHRRLSGYLTLADHPDSPAKNRDDKSAFTDLKSTF